jgi:tetratricopeptide (TPR) repeat protein
MLDWALSEAGRREDAVHSQRALDIYAQLGDPEREARVVMNLGAFAYEDGLWDEAVNLYRRAAALGTRAGNPDVTATSEVNIGEILSDQGRLEEADASLNRARRVYNSIGQMQGVAFVSMLLGRLAVREARYDEGRSLLQTASLELARLSMDYYVAVARAYLAEAEAFGGDAREALELADRLLATTDRNLALVRRVRAVALIRLGRTRAAIDELEASLIAADGHGTDYDAAAALDLLDALGASADVGARRDAILSRLRVQQLHRPRTVESAGGGELSAKPSAETAYIRYGSSAHAAGTSSTRTMS